MEITAGTYAGLGTETFRGTGTSANPILIYANPLGGAKFTGNTSIVIDGEYITVAGLVFDGNGSPNQKNGIIEYDDNSRNCRVTNCLFRDFNDLGHIADAYWVFMEGFENRFDHNYLEGKTSTNVVLNIKPNASAEGFPNEKRLHQIDHNYFGERTVIGGNGYETIRVSDSARQGYDMSITVEHNYFYRAIVSSSSGEPEVISNKSKGNIYRYNTLRECDGQITLRHGDECIVEGNFFLGTGGSQESGVRIIGEDHVVKNNYFQDLNGTGLRAALVLMKGDSGWPASDDSNGYEVANNALIANNTFINCKIPLNLGEENSTTVAPVGTEVYNNLVISTASNSTVFDIDTGNGFPVSSITFAGNMVYHPSSNYGTTGITGVTYGVDANHTLSGALGYYVPGPTSGSVDAGSNFTPTNTIDVTGRTRNVGTIDIGAVEYGLSGAVVNEPLADADVGPAYEGGPAGSFAPPDDSPVLTVASFPNASVGVAYSQFATVSGGDAPLAFTIQSGALPAGLILNANTGEISGTPTAAVTENFTLRVTDDDNDFDQDTFSITAVVVDLMPTITTTSLADVEFDDYYLISLAASSGDAPLTWSYTGDLPTGVQLNSDGSFQGRLGEVGTFDFTASVTDLDGDIDTQALSLTVMDTTNGYGSYIEVGGQVVMEAEGYTSKASGLGEDWTEVTVSGASGAASDNAMQILPNLADRADTPGSGPVVSYSVFIQDPDNYYVHVRAQGPNGSSDSIHVTVDGNTGDYDTLNLSSGGWDWDRSGSFNFSAGVHTIDIWMREAGSIIDKIVVNQSATNQTGTGPAVSADPVFPVTFSSWKIDHLGSDTPPDSDDPEADGYTLVEEYFWDLDPTAVDAPGARPYVTADGDDHTVHFRYNVDASDLRVLIEAGDDLSIFNATLVDTELSPAPALSGGWATVDETDPTPSSPRFFDVQFEFR